MVQIYIYIYIYIYTPKFVRYIELEMWLVALEAWLHGELKIVIETTPKDEPVSFGLG
jgi:hypothetical protein